MKYQETGRIGRITKNLRKLGQQEKMDKILFDTTNFGKIKKTEQAKYIEELMGRMVREIGQDEADAVMFSCGKQCCGKSWALFSRQIWIECNKTIEDYVCRLNKKEKQYDTYMEFDSKKNTIKVFRTRCICGMINKGKQFKDEKTFCKCSIGHMDAFFREVFSVKQINLLGSIMTGKSKCEWHLELNKT